MIYREEKRDLFTMDKGYVLAQCISLDCAMSAGIALQFVNRYPQMKPTLIKTIKENNLNHPCTILYISDNGSVFNLITKKNCWDKPTYESLKETLKEMKRITIENNINTLAIPKIGCGIDKLKWSKVKEMIMEVFSDSNIEIVVCIPSRR